MAHLGMSDAPAVDVFAKSGSAKTRFRPERGFCKADTNQPHHANCELKCKKVLEGWRIKPNLKDKRPRLFEAHASDPTPKYEGARTCHHFRPHLEQSIHGALALANARKHELATLEHLLLALD